MIQMLGEILKTSLNHSRAYLVRGNKTSVLPEIFVAVEKEWGIVVQGNPNVMVADGHLSVDEARKLVEFSSMSTFGKDRAKLIILSAERMTREAQNTLLKLTEEPNSSLRIFVIVSKDVELLPTLLSRLEDISFAFTDKAQSSKLPAQSFLSMGLKERFKLAEKIAKDEDETALDVFLRDLENKVYKHKYKNILEKEKVFSSISFAKQSASSQGRQKRMILETLSISLPVV